MPINKQETNSPDVHHYTYEPFMPIEDLDLFKFKEHIDYLNNVEKTYQDIQSTIDLYFNLFESEYRAYFYNTDAFKFQNDVAYDMDAIINTLDAMDFARIRIKDVRKFIHKRIILIYAIALIRALSMWNQSYEETLLQLEIPEQYYQEIISKIQILENNNL